LALRPNGTASISGRTEGTDHSSGLHKLPIEFVIKILAFSYRPIGILRVKDVGRMARHSRSSPLIPFPLLVHSHLLHPGPYIPRIRAPSVTDDGSNDPHSWQLLSELQTVYGDLSASRERIGPAPTADSGRAGAFCKTIHASLGQADSLKFGVAMRHPGKHHARDAIEKAENA